MSRNDPTKGSMGLTTISVVIPTRDRPTMLRRCLEAVLSQSSANLVEVIIVNDGCRSVDGLIRADKRLRVLEGPGRGPAAARNAGIASATGDVVLFTDDDTVPQPRWLEATISCFTRHPEAVGVVGLVESPPFDPLYEHSVSGEGVGNFLTCNAAYRRATLVNLGGFDEGFRDPACEDRDMGYRAQQIGEVIFESEMRVVHPPRPISALAVIRRGRLVESDWRLHLKHPQTRPPRWSTRWGPAARVVRMWQRTAADELRTPNVRRLGRLLVMAGGQIALATWITLTRWTTSSFETAETNGNRARLRVAYVGPTPTPGGGVAGAAWLVVQRLAQMGCAVDCFLNGIPEDVPTQLHFMSGVRVVHLDTGWRWDRWYSRNRTMKVLTGNLASVLGRRRLSREVAAAHAHRPYDVLYQFSTIELIGLRRFLDRLPPIVVHPSTHMAGELSWFRAERNLARRCEPWHRRLLVEALLAYRAHRQRRDIHLADHVIALSRVFGEALVRDYGIGPEAVSIVPYPVDLRDFRRQDADRSDRKLQIGCVSRISARKGIEQIIELTHRLSDRADDVELQLVGDHTLWSDYRPLLTDLNRAVATYRGPLPHRELPDFLSGLDLLVHPAKYEPFGLVIAEALACGTPVVTTDQVGAAEGVNDACCAIVPPSDVNALERAVRAMLDRMDSGAADSIRSAARIEAELLFSPDRVTAAIVNVLTKFSESAQARYERKST
jgi:glycosyltransferase involved in cell wall biosynthesis